MKLDSYIGVKLLKNFIYVAKQKTKKKFPLIHLKFTFNVIQFNNAAI